MDIWRAGNYSAASLCPSRALSLWISSSAASAITVPGGKIASAPALKVWMLASASSVMMPSVAVSRMARSSSSASAGAALCVAVVATAGVFAHAKEAENALRALAEGSLPLGYPWGGHTDEIGLAGATHPGNPGGTGPLAASENPKPGGTANNTPPPTPDKNILPGPSPLW